jgi:anti-anti-sigma regulatory factor
VGTHITVSPGGYAATLIVDDDIDDRARPAIESAASGLPRSVRRLTLDLAGVGFVDSALLHLLLSVDGCVTGRGGLLRIVGLRPQPRRLLALAADVRPEPHWEVYLRSPGPN